MEFCKVCNNLLYLQMDEDRRLMKHCKCCQTSFEEERKGLRISKAVYSEDDMLFMYHQNPYLRFDPTLPRINNVACPKKDCIGRLENRPNQVIYVKYNPVKMSYFYTCEHCGDIWKSEKSESN